MYVEGCEDVGRLVDGGAEGTEVAAAVAGEGEGVGGDGDCDQNAGELRGGDEERSQRHLERSVGGNDNEQIRPLHIS